MSHPKNALLNARLHPCNSHPDQGQTTFTAPGAPSASRAVLHEGSHAADFPEPGGALPAFESDLNGGVQDGQTRFPHLPFGSCESPRECRLPEPGCDSVLAGGIPAERGIRGLEVQLMPPSRSGLEQNAFHRLC